MAQIVLEVTFDPEYIMALCNWLRLVNTSLLLRNPQLPLLYDSGVVYLREDGEAFRDVVAMYGRGHEDCDSLAPARAGELLARGHQALREGDEGFELARRLKPRTINAWCFFTTRDDPNAPGPKLWHVEVNYELAGQTFHDDPSARLGMYDGEIDPTVATRWERSGVEPGRPYLSPSASVGAVPVGVRHGHPCTRRPRR